MFGVALNRSVEIRVSRKKISSICTDTVHFLSRYPGLEPSPLLKGESTQNVENQVNGYGFCSGMHTLILSDSANDLCNDFGRYMQNKNRWYLLYLVVFVEVPAVEALWGTYPLPLNKINSLICPNSIRKFSGAPISQSCKLEAEFTYLQDRRKFFQKFQYFGDLGPNFYIWIFPKNTPSCLELSSK